MFMYLVEWYSEAGFHSSIKYRLCENKNQLARLLKNNDIYGGTIYKISGAELLVDETCVSGSKLLALLNSAEKRTGGNNVNGGVHRNLR